MSEGKEGPATAAQRVFLLCHTFAGAGLFGWALVYHPWVSIPFGLGLVFFISVTVANWHTTYYGPPEWHDYR